MHTQKILAIEDNTILVRILQQHMKDLDFSIAIHPDEGVAKAVEEHPALILLDIMLPDRGGFTVLEELKKRPETKAIPVLMFTALGNEDEIDRAMQMGADGFIVKGMESIDDVAGKIRTLIGRGNQTTPIQTREKTTEAEDATGTVAPPRVKKKTVLFVEDDVFLVRAYRDLLEADNTISVLVAEDGDKAVAMLTKPPPDLVVLDLMLPGKNGFEVLSALRINKRWERVPVMILSNLSQQEDIERAVRLGAVDYVVKANTRMSDIATRIHKLLYAAEETKTRADSLTK